MTRRLRELDLNLLVVFRDLMQTRSISATALRLGMSQPAASNALARLRAALGDPLLVRAGNRMQPTRLAERIARDVDEGIARLESAIGRHDSFNPARDARRFVVAMTDLGEVYFLPRLLEHCMRHAPGVRIEVSHASGAALRGGLQDGSIDLALGPYVDLPDGIQRRPLFRQSWVTLFRRGHPFSRRPPAGLPAWRAARHLMVRNLASPYLEARQRMEKAGVRFSEHDQVASFLAAPFAVAVSDCVVTVPGKLAAQFAGLLGLEGMPPPLRLPELVTQVFWHRRNHAEPGLAWLRDAMGGLFAETATPRG